MADASFRVEGLDELRRAFRKIDADLPKALRQENLTAAQIVATAALPNVPVYSGRLAASVRASATPG